MPSASPNTPTALEEFFQVASMVFLDVYGETPSFWNQLATEVPSNTKKNVYPWLARTVGLREWLGDRVVQNLSARSYELLNKHWEGTMGIDRDDLDDDLLGIYKSPVEQLGQEAAEFRDREIARTIEAGVTELCWDNQFYFDTDHPVDVDDAGKGTQSNKLVGASYDLSVNPVDAFKLARAAQRKWKRDDGRHAGLMGNLLVVGPDLEEEARQVEQAFNVVKVIQNVAGNENVAGASKENVFKGSVDVLVLPDLVVTSGKPWYLFDTRKKIKPFLWQNRQAPMFDILNSRTDHNVFSSRQILAGVDLRGAAGYTFPGLGFRMSAS